MTVAIKYPAELVSNRRVNLNVLGQLERQARAGVAHRHIISQRLPIVCAPNFIVAAAELQVADSRINKQAVNVARVIRRRVNIFAAVGIFSDLEPVVTVAVRHKVNRRALR